jgi:hypothetical protein
MSTAEITLDPILDSAPGVCEACGNEDTEPAILTHEDDDGTVSSRTFTLCREHERQLAHWVLSMSGAR